MCVNATRCAYLVDFIEAVLGPDGRPYASFVDGCLDKCSTTWRGEQVDGTGVGVLTTLSSGPRLCKDICWRYQRRGKMQLDSVAAFEFATNPARVAASVQHANISARDQELIEQATRSRLDATGH